MSISEQPASPAFEPQLIVTGPPGVEIQIVDGSYHVRARGTEQLKERLPEGIYIVRWIAGEHAHEEIVRLLAVRKALRVEFPGFLKPTPSRPARSGTGLPDSLDKLRKRAPRPGSAPSIVVLERTNDPKLVGKLAAGLRLFNRDEVAMRSDSSDVRAKKEWGGKDKGWALRVYHVPPGDYRLRYVASTGMTLDQTVVAIDGRRTMVMLRQKAAETLVADAGKYTRKTYIGVDPHKIIINTTTLNSSAESNVDMLRMAEVLLQALALREDPLDQKMLQRIKARDADPLLRVYAAALILSRLEDGGSPALDDSYPSRPRTSPQEQSSPDPVFEAAKAKFEERWRAEAKRLLDGLDSRVSIPDVTACRWKLGDRKGALVAPPMLDCCWQWAAAHSATAPDTVPDTASFRGASLGSVAAAPWLAWRGAAAKEGTVEGLPPSSPTTESGTGAGRLAKSLQDLFKTAESHYGESATRILDSLSPEARGLVSTALKLDFGQQEGALGKLAGALRTSAPQLDAKLQRASYELESAAEEESKRGSGPRAPQSKRRKSNDPPALSKPIVIFDDPHKGRFGKRAKVKGFSLQASFTTTGDPKWVSITLSVTASPKVKLRKSDRVEFFLHDTFNPDRITVPFTGQKAELTVRAFGGFTVGAWLPSHKVQLELDLAELKYAPRIVKEW